MGPPAIPKGTRPPSYFTRKPSRIPNGKVWIQGKLREKNSRAAKQHRAADERKFLKILQRPEQGKTIWAYNHIRTNQVVYSLSRFLQEDQVLSQLLDHGKKTIPPSLRKDIWTPYFSLHFPTQKHGLVAYQQLRELSNLRQLAPPKSMITNTEASRLRFHPEAIYNPSEDVKTPKLGKLMPKKQRARVLMDQKATSVADAAFVLGLQDEIKPDEPKSTTVAEETRKGAGKPQLKSTRRRIDLDTALEKQYEKYLAALSRPSLPLSPSLNSRLKYDVDGRFIRRTGGFRTLPKEQESQDEALKDILVLWADLRDAAYAEKWPPTVFHGELERGAEPTTPSLFLNVHVAGKMRDREAEALEKQRRQEILQAGADVARVESAAEPDVEPPPKSIGSRVADTLMFWRR